MSGSENPMAEARPAASLTANLLARRGAARPAMRRQPLGAMQALPASDDLGWNDMGHDAQAQANPAQLTDIQSAEAQFAETQFAETQFIEPEPIVETGVDAVEARAPVSPINDQLQALARRINVKPAPRDTAQKLRPLAPGRKAAFTLRIDADRHLRLRLLSAVSNRSAQHLLIEALDQLISNNDELQALAGQVEARKRARAK